MTSLFMIIICLLLLLSYVFDLSSKKSKIPGAILLLLMGLVLRNVISASGWIISALDNLLPVVGNIGLLLIVLEGVMDLRIKKESAKVYKTAFVVSILPVIIMAAFIHVFLYVQGYVNIRVNLLNAIPFCIISSALAIPGSGNLSGQKREFITLESSLSDIIGVMLFNFLSYNAVMNIGSLGVFAFQLILMVFFSLTSTIFLAFFMRKTEHHIKTIPLFLMIVLIYSVAKHFHLPALLFIMIFGLLLGNHKQLPGENSLNLFSGDKLEKEIFRMKELLHEGTFLVRSLFFLLFGFSITLNELFDPSSLFSAIALILLIFSVRFAQLYFMKLPILPMVFIAPRGLITILLYLSIPLDMVLAPFTKSLIVQVIFLSSVTMAVGLLYYGKDQMSDNETLL